MRDALTFLEPDDRRAGATSLSIQSDPELAEAFGRTGRAVPSQNPQQPGDAVIRVNPGDGGASGWDQFVAGLARFGEGAAQAVGAAPAAPDLCDVLLDEMDHAMAFMTGREDGGAEVCQLSNGRLEEREVSAMALTNVYRSLSGRESIWGYPGKTNFFGVEIDGFVRLPDRAIHPTPEAFGFGGQGGACHGEDM
jgi:hypothetical protein